MIVKKVKYIKDYKLELVFNNKIKKTVDFAPIIKEGGKIFSPLENIDYFKSVRVDDDLSTVVWPNGADICPDYLYEIGKEEK